MSLRHLLLPALCLMGLSSCLTGYLVLDSSTRLEAALRDGEAKSAHFETRWQLEKPELIEVAYANDQRAFYMPIIVEADYELSSLLEYRRGAIPLSPTAWESGKKKGSIPPRRMYVSLSPHLLKRVGALKLAPASIIAWGNHACLAEEFPVQGMRVVRRVSAPDLKKIKQNDLDLGAYYTPASLATQALVGTTWVLVDIPASAFMSSFTMLYENTFGWIRVIREERKARAGIPASTPAVPARR